MFCVNCGKEITAGSKFCIFCGNKISHIKNDVDNILTKNEVKEIKKDEKENLSFKRQINQNDGEPMGKKQISLEPVSQGKRFANFLLDYIFIYCFGFLLGLICWYMGLYSWIENMNDFVAFFLNIFIFVLYYLFFETLFSKSIAKFITRTKVVNDDGSKPEFKTILGRTLARVIPFEPFSFFSKTPVGWHDSLSKTIVVDDK